MCYSAEASFTAATVIGVLGYLTVKQVRVARQIPLAIMPCFFALQQAAEGIQWVFLDANIPANALSVGAMWVYLFFAYILWPTLFPLSALSLERVSWRRNVLKAFLVLGAGISGYNVWHFANHDIFVELVNGSIRYANTDYSQGVIYLAVMSFPYLFSSLPVVSILGVVAPVSFAISGYVYWVNFASIWCFWAALLSGLVWVSTRRYSETLHSRPVPKH